MGKIFSPVNFGVAVIVILSAVGWVISDNYKTGKAERLQFRDTFFLKMAIDQDKTGLVCNGCWLHELNRDHTVPVDIKRYIIDIPRLEHIDLSGSDLTGSYFTKAIAISANFSGALLNMALFDLADLSNANLSGAQLRGANLRYANLEGANFSGADLSPQLDTSWLKIFHAEFEEYGGTTELIGAKIAGANFTNANLTDVKMTGVKGAESAIFCNTVMPDGSISNTGCK